MDKELKAWRLNEYEWWAHYSLDEAVEHAMNFCGVSREDMFDEDYAGPADLEIQVIGDDGKPEGTIGSIVAKTTEPGFICGSEC